MNVSIGLPGRRGRSVFGVASRRHAVLAGSIALLAWPASSALAAPNLSSVVPSNGPTVGNTSITLNGSSFSASGNEVKVDGEPCTIDTEGTNQIICRTPPGTGATNPTVVFDDTGAAGNSVNFAYDAPTMVSVTPSNGPTSGNTLLTISGTNFGASTADSVRTVTVGGQPCTLSAGLSSHGSILCSTPPGSGLSQVIAVTVDGQAATGSVSFHYDAPSISSIAPSNGPTTGANTLTLTGSNFGPSGNTVLVGGVNCPVTSNGTSSVECTAPAGTGTGKPVRLFVSGQLSNTTTYSYDAPTVSGITPANGPKAGGTVLTISGSNFGAAGTTRSISIGGVSCPATAPDSQTQIGCTLPAGQGTNLPVQVTVTGQSNSSGATFSYDAPSISSISPTNGPTGGGIPLTINGSDFSTTGNTVSVGGAGCPPTAQSSSQILCTLPEGTGTANDVTVVDAIGGSSNAENFAYDPPSISSITPGNGPTAGGSILTIVGSNFGAVGADAVRTINLGGQGCIGVAGLSDHTMIRCTTPSGAGVDRSVTVSVDGQSSNSLLFDYDAPSITSVEPLNGPTAGSVPLTIRGQNFAPDSNAASVGGSSCAVSSETTTEIVCDLPEGTGLGRIVSMDAAGQGAVGPLFHYDPPVVSSVTPSNGPTAGNVPITINGLNFGAAGADALRSATVGTVDCPLLPSSSSHTSIVCTLPEGQGLGNTVHVVVDTQPSNDGSFGYDAPLISSITPASPPAAGNVPITVQGANFGLSATATVGGLSCPLVEQTHSSLTCMLPAGSGSSVPVLVAVSGQVGLSSLDYKTPLCGDGVNDTDEDCDDSNSDDLDGCSARCETEDSQDKDQAACIVGLNKSGAGVAKAQGRAVLACAKDAAVGVPCIGAPSVPEGVAKASAKVTSTFDKKCQSLPDFGPVDAAVVSQAAIDQDLALAHAIFGADPDAALVPDAMNPARSDCQQDVIAATEKLMGAGLKAFGKCKKDGLKEETIRATSQLGACLGFIDEDSNWDKAAARVSSVLTDSCAGVDLATALPGDCASAPDKGACLEGRVLCHTCHLLVIGDNLDEDCDLIDDLTDNGSCD